jgi:hypothetical protein
MENKNPLIRLVIYGKIKRMMNAYKGELTKKEKKLVRGVFTKKIKDFDEEYKDFNENRTLLMKVRGVMMD